MDPMKKLLEEELQARRRRDEREAQRQIHERAERVAEPRNDDGPPPRID